MSVPELLRQVVARGEAFRLAWRGSEIDAVVDNRREFPTAVLPAVRDEDEHGDADEITEPTTATGEAQRWFGPAGLVRWPLAG